MAEEILDPTEWLKRAESNLMLATAFKIDCIPENVYLEDLCFELQQCAEKSIKAVLIHFGVNFPKTHNISELLLLLKKQTTLELKEEIVLAAILTPYAVKTRYPMWHKISKDEYVEAIQITKNILEWAQSIIQSN